MYTITKRNPCHLVPAQSFHEKNVLQAVESFGKGFFDAGDVSFRPRTFFTQKLETIPTGVGQQGDETERNKKLGGCNTDELRPMDT